AGTLESRLRKRGRYNNAPRAGRRARVGGAPAVREPSGTVQVNPARNSRSVSPSVRATRHPTSSDRVSRTFQIAPTSPDTVRTSPCSSTNSATGLTAHPRGLLPVPPPAPRGGGASVAQGAPSTATVTTNYLRPSG